MSKRISALAGFGLLTVAYVGLSGAMARQGLSFPLWILFAALGVWYAICGIQIVNEWVRRPVMLFGRYIGTLGPGLRWVDPIFFSTLKDKIVQDVVLPMDVPEVQTKDNVGIKLGGVLTYCIDRTKVRDAVVNVQDVTSAIRERSYTTLTDVAATQDLDQLLESRDSFCELIKQKLIERTAEWGVTIKAFELKAFSINDTSVAEAIAMKARAQKEGAAGLVRAKMQHEIAQALNAAAETYTADGRWLKGVEVLTELCRSAQNNTIILPSDLAETVAGLVRTKG